MGSSSAFYTFISQRKRTISFYLYYLAWTGAQFLVVTLLIAFFIPDFLRERIWLGHDREIILLAFLASFTMNKLWELTVQAGESIRKTVVTQAIIIILSLTHLCLIVIMIKFDYLAVRSLFLVLIGEYLLFTAFLAYRLKRELVEKGHEEAPFLSILREFRSYCTPLMIYAWVGFAYTFADTWMLQHFGGATQQGFFSIGQRFSVLSLIATTSMLKIFWKEIAESNWSKDLERVRRLYYKTSRALYFVGALVSCFLIPYSREILGSFLGTSYEPAWWCLTIMLLYPIHQSMGQIGGTFFYATERTLVYRNIGVIMMGVSIPVTYFVLAPPTAWVAGLGLGATGIALKMVGLQFIGVNIQAYVISRVCGWRFDFWYQLLTVALLLVNSLVTKYFSLILLGMLGVDSYFPLCLIPGAALYLTGAVTILYIFPWIAGVNKEELSSVSSSARAIITRAWEYIR